MTDLEITRLCAGAMGAQLPMESDAGYPYDPLHDDAQAMALVKKFDLCLDKVDGRWGAWHRQTDSDGFAENLNRAICECVAQMQAAK